MALVAKQAADVIAPIPSGASESPDAILKNDQVRSIIATVSPVILYSEATGIVLDPLRKTTRSLVLMGPMEQLSISRFQSPLPLLQSALIVAPHLVSLLAITVVCFGISYACFLRQEVRST
jgi:ABC-2 type transport system permease protein